MVYACVVRFDVTENLEKFWIFGWTKQGQLKPNSSIDGGEHATCTAGAALRFHGTPWLKCRRRRGALPPRCQWMLGLCSAKIPPSSLLKPIISHCITTAPQSPTSPLAVMLDLNAPRGTNFAGRLRASDPASDFSDHAGVQRTVQSLRRAPFENSRALPMAM